MDITSSINHLVDAIVSEVSNSPVDIHNTGLGVSSRANTTSNSTQVDNTDGNYEILISDNSHPPSPPITNHQVRNNMNDVVTVADQTADQTNPSSTSSTGTSVQ